MSRDLIPTDKAPMTGQALWEMGDIGRCEMVEGRIVRMSPTGGEHGRIEAVLARELGAFEIVKGTGWVLVGEVGIYTGRDPDTVRGADLVFVSRKQSAEGRPEGYLEVAPELVIEIVSPTDRWEDLRQKIEEYFAIGVEQVWVVEPDNRAVLVYGSATEMRKYEVGAEVVGEGVVAGFVVEVGVLFE